MNKIKQIQALFLLSIITVLMFHTALPHVHHFHSEFKSDQHTHLDHHHDHSHHTHTHDSHQDHSEDNPLDNLLDELAHGVHSDEYLSGDQSIHIDFNDNLSFNLPFLNLHLEAFVFSPQLEQNNLHRYTLYKRGHYQNPFLLTNALRAPPAHGEIVRYIS